MLPATCIAAVRAGSTSSIPPARNLAASSTASPQPRTSASAATIGRRCSLQAACTWARSTSRSPASRCRLRRRRKCRVGKGALIRNRLLPISTLLNAEVGQARLRCAVPTFAVGTLRFAHPTNPCLGGNIMTNHHNISRRQMLAMSAAAGSLAISGIGGASAQQQIKRIEQLDPVLDKIISTSEPINDIAQGMGGPLGPVEGPVWWKEGGYLLFSDIHASKRMKSLPGQGVTVFQEKTTQANGLPRDLQGRLLACEHETRRVTRQELDGSITVIANSFQGRRLNRPNDVVVKSDGSIFFTDPWTSPDIQQQWDLTFMGVYRVTPDLGTMTLLVDDFLLPNGIAFSPDESVLYVNDSRRRHIRAFDVAPNGTLAKQSDRVFAELGGAESGVPDGMKVDTLGNVYCGGAGGIYVLDPKGKKLGRIVHGQPATPNNRLR